MPGILSTKLLKAAVAADAETSGLLIEQVEMIGIRPVTDERARQMILQASTEEKEVVVTSANAAVLLMHQLEHVGIEPLHWNYHCIEGNTSRQVGERMPTARIFTARNARELAMEIVAQKIDSVIFFCGRQRRNDLPELLRAHGITVDEIVLYETIQTPVKVKTDFDAVLFFSPSAVESFFSANTMNTETVCFAIGDTTAASVRAHTANKVVVCSSADQHAMLKTVNEYFSGTTNSE